MVFIRIRRYVTYIFGFTIRSVDTQDWTSVVLEIRLRHDLEC